MKRLAFSVSLAAALAACQGSDFTGSSGAKKIDTPRPASGDATKTAAREPLDGEDADKEVDVNVPAGTHVKLDCRARLADSQVQVAVGGNAKPVSGVGVHVFSDITLDRVGTGCP